MWIATEFQGRNMLRPKHERLRCSGEGRVVTERACTLTLTLSLLSSAKAAMTSLLVRLHAVAPEVQRSPAQNSGAVHDATTGHVIQSCGYSRSAYRKAQSRVILPSVSPALFLSDPLIEPWTIVRECSVRCGG